MSSSQRYLEKTTAVTGVGLSEVARPSEKTALALTIDASLAAIEDAGLTRDDIDGIATWPGRFDNTPGLSEVSLHEVKEALRLPVNWYMGGGEAPQHGAVISAITAIATGFARNVLIYRTVTEAQAQTPGRRASVIGAAGQRLTGWLSWLGPSNALSAAIWVALYAQRHFDRYGTTSEQLAQIALTARRNAQVNPSAIMRTPLTLDDYMTSRFISTPLRLFDCDVPVDGSTAIIISRLDAARDLRNPPLRIEAMGCALHGRFSWEQVPDLHETAAFEAARMMWNRTDLKPKDVDVAELYDGFSFLCLMWLEALGFCAKGEGGRFIEGGGRIARDGELPLNTHGGQLSQGRLHGYGQIFEAAAQLWSRAGARQVANHPRVAVCSAGGGPLGSSFLLVRD
ncbi:MAG: thiolase family protein [Steroidobacteraceae bacterium]